MVEYASHTVISRFFAWTYDFFNLTLNFFGRNRKAIHHDPPHVVSPQFYPVLKALQSLHNHCTIFKTLYFTVIWLHLWCGRTMFSTLCSGQEVALRLPNNFLTATAEGCFKFLYSHISHSITAELATVVQLSFYVLSGAPIPKSFNSFIVATKCIPFLYMYMPMIALAPIGEASPWKEYDM